MFRAGNTQGRRRAPARGRRPAALAVLCAAALACALTASPASAQVTLGTSGTGTASCPENCLVEARVTGFQTMVGGAKAAVKAPAAGRITDWSINLGAPDATAIKYFNKRFGQSMARISILKAIPRTGGKATYRLLRQTPAQELRPYFGKLTTFRLARPLRVGKGQVLALTIPTWTPAFSVGHLDSTRWRASRAPTRRRGDCFTNEGLANLDAGSPQQRLGSDRAYGCSYRGAMLLYSATFVPKG
jgi:hypothetical protein